MKAKKLVSLVLLVVVTVGVAGCFTIKVGGKAELATSTEEGTKIAQKRYWYALWGLVPIGDNSTDSLIPGTVKKSEGGNEIQGIGFFDQYFYGYCHN